ncbi:MAG: AlpA family phage regulatory protein [Alphaproteobacteria bacterium]|nr:MAG: AlpA family phage regulatory protein [Alphaproteobacteria bacterium]
MTSKPRPYLRPRHVVEELGIAESTLYRWLDEGKFPRPQKLNGTLSIWTRETIDEWIASQNGERS